MRRFILFQLLLMGVTTAKYPDYIKITGMSFRANLLDFNYRR